MDGSFGGRFFGAPGEAVIGIGLIMSQFTKALSDIDERYDFVEKSGNVSALG